MKAVTIIPKPIAPIMLPAASRPIIARYAPTPIDIMVMKNAKIWPQRAYLSCLSKCLTPASRFLFSNSRLWLA